MIRLGVAGTTTFGLPSFDLLRTDPAVTVVGAISQPNRPIGRKQTLTKTPIAAWATKYAIPLLTPEHWKSAEMVAQLGAWKLDLLLVAAYGLIVPPTVLGVPKYGCINIHASLLPRYRGASPIAAAILNGDATTGITFMVMDQGMDTGPILKQYSLDLAADETTPTVSDKLSQLAREHIAEMVTQYVNHTTVPQPQPSGASIAKKIKRSDGLMSWESAVLLDRKLRAYTPWPGLWTTWKGTVIKILAGSVIVGEVTEPIGQIVPHGEGWAVVCDDGLFVPTQVQVAGKRPQPAGSLPGGYPGFLYSYLGN